jgi:hypothetical protein
MFEIAAGYPLFTLPLSFLHDKIKTVNAVNKKAEAIKKYFLFIGG